MSALVELPNRGRLIIATDLQGNLQDFLRLIDAFERAHEEDEDGAHLVITGDLVHGPEIPAAHWPEYLGSFYEGDSAGVLCEARALSDKYPDRVHFLLGNHEHAHLGGPVVAKFFDDEAARLEHVLGPDKAADFRDWLRSWPLVAMAPTSGIAMLHAAPAAYLDTAEDLHGLDSSQFDNPRNVHLMLDLLWSRSARRDQAERFLEALGPNMTVTVYGHDVARGGFCINDEPMLCVSTSFGCFDGDKLFVEWDLATPVRSAEHLATEGLRPLYPERPPVLRCTPSDVPEMNDTTLHYA